MSNAYQRPPLVRGTCKQCNEEIVYGVWKFKGAPETFCSWACSEGFRTGDGSKVERLPPRALKPQHEDVEQEVVSDEAQQVL